MWCEPNKKWLTKHTQTPTTHLSTYKFTLRNTCQVLYLLRCFCSQFLTVGGRKLQVKHNPLYHQLFGCLRKYSLLEIPEFTGGKLGMITELQVDCIESRYFYSYLLTIPIISWPLGHSKNISWWGAGWFWPFHFCGNLTFYQCIWYDLHRQLQ